MTENAQNPGDQNPSKADASYEYETAWKGFNHILYIVQNLPKSTYEQAIQDKLQDIQQYCSSACQNLLLMCQYGMDPSEAAKRIAPLADQLQASACGGVASMAPFIANPCKDMATFASEYGV